jgi:C-methyltransferase C-terminal domain/Putative zinc binding domain/Methyltransferase domain
MSNYSTISKCRISSSTNLIPVLSLGEQELTGFFPVSREQEVTRGPLDLVWCPESGLLQLKQSYNPGEMYGLDYGYRSGLNQSMVKHLTFKIRKLERLYHLQAGDTVIDIGSNDATSLKAYLTGGLRRIGIDPTGAKFKSYYTDGIELIPDFFSSRVYTERVGSQRAKIVTSIAMFYDLEDPAAFVRDIGSVLAPDGVWHFEQSYMPSMLRMNSYDTICHEHIEYYSLGPVKKLLENNGLKILDVQMNSVNGGSFAVTAALETSSLQPNRTVIDWFLGQEERMGLMTPRPFRQFEERVFEHRHNLIQLVRSLQADGKKIFGYGASTKGNVLLQFCGFTEKDIPFIAEVNPDKFGRFTPGSRIPIISEAEARAMKPDYYLVLPWHFKSGIVAREEEFLASGGQMIFPMPEIEIVGG